MIGKTIKEELIGYDLTILFSKEANEKDIIKFFSEFFDDKESYFIKEGYYGGFVQLAYKIRGRTDARFFSFHLYCLPSKTSTFIDYAKRSPIVMRTLLLKDNLKEGEPYTPFIVSDEEKGENLSIYKDLLKSIVS